MLSARPKHHANSSRSLFQNPWTVAESDAAPPSDYWPVSLASLRLPAFQGFPSISIERVRASESHPHPPIKVIRPDWGHPTALSSEPNLKATWLGHASFLVEFPCVGGGLDDKPLRVLFDPIFSDCSGPLPWLGVRRRLPPPCAVAELPEFQFVVYSHNHYDHLDLPTLQKIYELRAEHVHFLVPLGEFLFFFPFRPDDRVIKGNKTWFEEAGIPSSQVTELDWWDHTTLPNLPGSAQQLKFVCTPAQHTSEIGSKCGPFDVAMLPIWRGGTLSFIARLGFRLVHAPDSLLTAFHATPAQALRMHGALRARHSLGMHFATFAGSDVEALDPIVELERAKREARIVGDWWTEGGMGVIDIGETAVVHVGEAPQKSDDDHAPHANVRSNNETPKSA
ncbi:Metallo-hydrolase/oxidoreductase [Russula earlei]|uniref:Metallo-hydrolase/oxidoreductase n=1 Tax=Russula earlei TaxID=71964 RepID=A0ACC0U706_9AGAM|nr:Metallo-hydrolase/oxidoreductase [Russula earlei]